MGQLIDGDSTLVGRVYYSPVCLHRTKVTGIRRECQDDGVNYNGEHLVVRRTIETNYRLELGEMSMF